MLWNKRNLNTVGCLVWIFPFWNKLSRTLFYTYTAYYTHYRLLPNCEAVTAVESEYLTNYYLQSFQVIALFQVVPVLPVIKWTSQGPTFLQMPFISSIYYLHSYESRFLLIGPLLYQIIFIIYKTWYPFPYFLSLQTWKPS